MVGQVEVTPLYQVVGVFVAGPQWDFQLASGVHLATVGGSSADSLQANKGLPTVAAGDLIVVTNNLGCTREGPEL